MKIKTQLAQCAIAAALAVACASPALAKNTLRWGLANDAVSLDPQGRMVATDFIFLRAAYEGLLVLDKSLKPVPGLATSWTNPDPKTWVFKLRPGVKFHEGQAFTADDVVFTFNRAMAPTSAFQVFTKNVESVKALDPMTVEIKVSKPDPLFLANLASVFVMNASWAKANKVEKAPDAKNPEKYFSDANMNGTGAFKLVSRKPDVSTKFERNADWWGAKTFPGNVDELEVKPIGNTSTRVAALLSGDLELLTDVPLQDIQRVKGDNRFTTASAPQYRVIFFGYNFLADKLETSDAADNPFKKLEVRQAINMAIDANLIHDRIMRGVSTPTETYIPPGMAGYDEASSKRQPANPAKAKELLAKAGYPNGFTIRLDCTNNRYINDEQICQAAVSMLSKVGIKATLNAMPMAQASPLLTGKKSDFYLLGFGTPTNDAAFIGANLFLGGPFYYGYKNADYAATLQAAGQEMNAEKRDALLAKSAQIIKDDAAIAPVHFQVITWGMVKNLSMAVDPNDMPNFNYAVMK